MASVQAFDAIRAFIDDNWGGAAPLDCPLAWENETFVIPAPPNPWGRVLIDGSLEEQKSVGGGNAAGDLWAGERWDEAGTVTLSVFCPVLSGSRNVRLLLTAFADLCRGRDIGGIEFQAIRFSPTRSTDESGTWWGMSVVVDWLRRG